MFFDLNIKGNSYEKNIQLAEHAYNYGWNHINFSYSQFDIDDALNFKNDLIDEFKDRIAIDYTLYIHPKNSGDVFKTTKKFRDKVNCISIKGGDLKVNRAAVENIKVDVLSRPYFKRFDSGLNHILAKEAFDNNVAIELSFKDILSSYLSYRAKIIANFKDIYTLYNKFQFPLIISSGASNIFDIKSPRDLESFFKSTGFFDFNKSMEHCKNILEFNNNRSDLIYKGVRRVNPEA